MPKNMPTTSSSYPPEYFVRQDGSDDALFYTNPRMVVHIDDGAIRALSDLFAEKLPKGGTYLDLMSSWRSHLPDSLEPEFVVGLGLNSAEMEANPQLSSHILQNLNAKPELPFEDEQFDAVLCTVSVQYLIQPIEVFAEIRRVLKPGGICIVSFSNRCFPTKAVAAWVYSGDHEHVNLVNSYFVITGPWENRGARIKEGGANGSADPLFMIWGMKPSD